MIDIKNLKKGDKVVCLINTKVALKIGKEYTIKGIYDDDYGTDISVVNESGKIHFYSIFRFVSKAKFREFLIDEVDCNFSMIDFCKKLSKILELRTEEVISYHETLERLSELMVSVDNTKLDFEINNEIFEDENLFRLDEELKSQYRRFI